jgi:hypothetical protein
LEELPNYYRVINDSLIGRVLEGASLVGKVTMRFPASFRSSNRLFMGNYSLEKLFNYSRVFGNSLIGRVLKGAFLVNRITLRFSGVG